MGTNPQNSGSVQMVAQLAGSSPPGDKEPGANRTKEPLLNRSTASPHPVLTPPPASTQDDPHGAAPQNLPPRPPPAAEDAPIRVPWSNEPAPTNGTQEVSLLAATGDQTQRHTAPPAPGQRDGAHTAGGKEVQGGSVSSKGEVLERECRSGGAPEPPLQAGGAPADRGPLSENATHYGACNNQRPGKGSEPQRPGPGGSSPRPEGQGGASSAATRPGPASVGPEPAASENLNGLSEAEADPCSGQRPRLTPPAKPDQVTSAPVQPAEPQTPGLVPPGPALDPTAGLVPHGPALDPTAGLVAPGPALDPTAGQRSPQPPKSAGASDGTSGVAPAGRGPPPAYSSRTGSDKHPPAPAPGPKRYSEASTMTCGAGGGGVRGRDAEVQAVASTCSRAVSTSPSLLPLSSGPRPRAGLPMNRDQDQSLAVHYREGSATAPGPGLAHLPTGPSQIYMDSIVCAVDPDLGGPGVGPRLCSDLNANLVVHTEAHQEGTGPAPEDPAAGPPLKPVYQINIEHSAQREGRKNAVTPAPAGPQSAAPPGTPLSEPPAETPATQAPPHQLPPSQGPAGPNQPKPAGYIPTAAQPPSHSAANLSRAPPTPADASSKPKGSTAGAKGPRDPPRPGATAKDVSTKPAPEPETRGKKERGEEEEEEEEGAQQEKGIHEVVWDEQGMTWEVYGAGVDPESLGFAIQSHLQCKIKEQERKLVTRTSQRKSLTAAAESPHRPQKKPRRRRNIFRSMLRNVRRPPCCSRPSPASVLE